MSPDVLDSWKAIAFYLKRDIRTAQRWERTLCLPVHRVPNSKLVFAYRTELDAWLSQQLELAKPLPTPAEIKPTPRRWPVWLAVCVVCLSIPIFLFRQITPSTTIDSLAVVPSVNANGDPNADYLSEGIGENLISRFSQIPKLRVVPRSLAFAFKGTQIDPINAGRRLNARAVLMVRVTQNGDRLNVQTELVDVSTVAQLWGRQYNGLPSETIQMLNEIAKDVASRLGLHDRQTRRPTVNNDAFQAYMKGRYYWNRRTETTLKRAVDHFQKAIDLDPHYALAYAGLADCFIVYSDYEVEAPGESGPKAIGAAEKAIEIDGALADAYASLAFARMQYEWDWAAADRNFQKAIELDPNYATAHHWRSIYLESIGRTDEAVTSAKRAQQLDPVSMIITTQLGQALYFARRYDDAIEEDRKALDMDPNFARGHLFLGLAYEQKRMYPAAIAELQKALKLSGGADILGALGHAYAISGERAKALQLLGQLSELSKRRYIAPFDIALIHAGLNQKGPALEWLEKAVDDRSSRVKLLKVDPRFDDLRADPRFAALLERMGLK